MWKFHFVTPYSADDMSKYMVGSHLYMYKHINSFKYILYIKSISAADGILGEHPVSVLHLY